MLQHLPVAHPQEPLSHLHVGPQGHRALALAEHLALAQPHLPVAQPQSPSVQAHPGPQVQGMISGVSLNGDDDGRRVDGKRTQHGGCVGRMQLGGVSQ